MTNREKLEKMSNEELGEFLCENSSCHTCTALHLCTWFSTGMGERFNGFIEWLKAEVEEEE